MPRCKNNSDKKYTGRENSPRGKGWDSGAEKDGKRRRGTNGKMYESRGNIWRLVAPEGKGVRGAFSKKDHKYTPW